MQLTDAYSHYMQLHKRPMTVQHFSDHDRATHWALPRRHTTTAMALYGMLTGIILLGIRYATAIQLNLNDHGCIRKRVQ